MNRLKKLRLENNITIRELEEKSNISNSVICCLEQERRPFRQTHIDRLTSIFSVTSDYLLGKTDFGIIVHKQNGDEITLNEKEYNNLSKNISSSIIKRNMSCDVIITSKKETQTINIPSIVVYRELICEDGIDYRESLHEKINKITKYLNTEDLEKTIEFIEKYIIR